MDIVIFSFLRSYVTFYVTMALRTTYVAKTSGRIRLGVWQHQRQISTQNAFILTIIGLALFGFRATFSIFLY